MNRKHVQMVEFWSERAKEFATDPRANTNDRWLREIEIRVVSEVIDEIRSKRQGVRVLDFGCANGFSSLRLAAMFPDVMFTGVDINQEMIAVAVAGLEEKGQSNIHFRCEDVASSSFPASFDLIYGIRVFQNMDSPAVQKRYAEALIGMLPPSGLLLMIESYVDGYEQLNRDRAAFGLRELPMHPHLTLLTDEFDNFLAQRLTLQRVDNPFSSYYLSTRVLYSAYARYLGEEVDYDHPLHQLAARLPSNGDYGPMRLRLYHKV